MPETNLVGPFRFVSSSSLCLDLSSLKGEVMSIGEKSTLAVTNPEASLRMAMGEALTNMAGVVIKGLNHVQVSANWMAASGDPKQDSALRNGVEALSKISVDIVYRFQLEKILYK